MVAFGRRPAPIADEVVRLIRETVDRTNAAGGRPGHEFQAGETVRITDGPLRDMLAFFEGPSSGQDRVRVLLEFLGEANRMWVSAADLEKVPAGGQSPRNRPPRRTRGRGRPIKKRRA
jgi:transcription antitermination factor NusG